MSELKHQIETNIFGVCEYLGDKLNMPKAQIRKYFIYTSILAMGSPIIVYLIVAFWVKIRDYIKGSRNPVWDN